MQINGILMSKDTALAEVRNGEIIILNEKLLPLYLKNFRNIEAWLLSRAIDTHRTNSRLLKRALRLTNADEILIMECCKKVPIEVDSKYICCFILNRYKRIQELTGHI